MLCHSVGCLCILLMISREKILMSIRITWKAYLEKPIPEPCPPKYTELVGLWWAPGMCILYQVPPHPQTIWKQMV